MTRLRIWWTWTVINLFFNGILRGPESLVGLTLAVGLGRTAKWEVAIVHWLIFPGWPGSTLSSLLLDDGPQRDQNRHNPNDEENKLGKDVNYTPANTKLVSALTIRFEIVIQGETQSTKVAQCYANDYSPHFFHRELCLSDVVLHILNWYLVFVRFITDCLSLVLYMGLQLRVYEKSNRNSPATYDAI